MFEKLKDFLFLKAFHYLNRGGEYNNLLPRTHYNYAKDVGDGLSSSIIVATAMWIARQFPEAYLAIRNQDGELNYDHPLIQLFKHPNDWYGGGALRMAIALDYTINGNAYVWIEPRGTGKRPEGLIWIPSFLLIPKGSETELITHYEYQVNTGVKKIPKSDIIHFRNAIDPNDQKLGLSPLRSLLREVFTDDEAANFTAAVLRNMGFPGVIVSPANEGDTIGPKYRGKIKQYFQRMFRGDQRGKALVTTGRIRLDSLNVDLSKLNIDKLRAIPETRVTALMGVPAAVVGFGTGLEMTKVGATMKELRELAYESTIIPMQRIIAEEITRQLLPEFEVDPEKFEVIFDNSKVRVLQQDENEISDRYRNLYKDGVITRGEARHAVGLSATPEDDVYRTRANEVLIFRENVDLT